MYSVPLNFNELHGHLGDFVSNTVVRNTTVLKLHDLESFQSKCWHVTSKIECEFKYKRFP